MIVILSFKFTTKITSKPSKRSIHVEEDTTKKEEEEIPNIYYAKRRMERRRKKNEEDTPQAQTDLREIAHLQRHLDERRMLS